MKRLCKSCRHFYKAKHSYIYKRRFAPDLWITKRTPHCRMMGDEGEGGVIKGGYPKKCHMYWDKVDLDRFMGTVRPNRVLRKIEREIIK